MTKLVAAGSWGCFDEFNRLVPEVLSVCSVQYKCVTDAQKRKTMLPGRGLEYIDRSGQNHKVCSQHLRCKASTMPCSCNTYIYTAHHISCNVHLKIQDSDIWCISRQGRADSECFFLQAIENYTFVAADGVLMPLEEGTSAFITMNPGYIGRAELPESLKVSVSGMSTEYEA